MKFEQSKNPNLKKRKADEDVEKAGPSKMAKTDHPKKSNRLEAKATSSKASGVSYRSYLKLTESLTSPPKDPGKKRTHSDSSALQQGVPKKQRKGRKVDIVDNDLDEPRG